MESSLQLSKISKKVDYLKIIAAGLPFTDIDFPPAQSSLFNMKDSSLDD